MNDIVLPHDDTERYHAIADELGYDTIHVVGNDTLLADERNDVDKHHDKHELVLATSQWAFNDARVDIIFNLEATQRDDFIHHRASGMNHVLAKQAAANETAIGFNFSLCYDDKKSTFLGRMQQNVHICRKYNVPMVIASFAVDPMEMRHPKDLEAFGRVIGMHQQEATDALQW